MIIHHQDSVAAFAGAHTVYWPTQPLLFQRVSATSAVVVSAVNRQYLKQISAAQGLGIGL